MGEEGEYVVVVCKTGSKVKLISKILILALLFVFAACSASKKLIYKDDWEGRYTLVEYNSCCDTATKVKLNLIHTGADRYDGKIFFEDGKTDTVAGEASSIHKK
jgi:hypothetical protein